jgi:lipoate-protein ligase A
VSLPTLSQNVSSNAKDCIGSNPEEWSIYRQLTPLKRTWIHQHTVILGIHDSRLPFLKDGIDYLTNEIGYNAIVI